MIIRLSLIFVFVITVFKSPAQKQDYIWYLGKDQSVQPGIQTMEVNFSRGAFDIEQLTTPVGFDHNNHAICNENGELLFYTNGSCIVNREHELMPNGHRMNWDSLFTEYLGWNEDCRLGYPGTQNMVILSDPAYEKGYYILHKAGYLDSITFSSRRELRYSYVNLELDNGLGDLSIVDSILLDIIPLSSYLTAIKHSNGIDWWVLQPMHDDSTCVTFRVNSDGITRVQDQDADFFFSGWFSSAAGAARFSPDGSRYAYFNPNDDLHLYDFDRETGLISNHVRIELYASPQDSFSGEYGGLEWSPDSRFLYVTDTDTLYQIDTHNEEIEEDDIRLIDVYNGTLDPFRTNLYQMALAPDCRIYMCSTNGSGSYHVINSPNELGVDCDFIQNGIKLPQNAGSANIPLHPRWRIDEEEVCDSTISSIFGDQIFYRRDLKVFPNPTTDFINIELPEQTTGHLYIIDMMGNIIHVSQDVRESQFRLNLSSYTSGNYSIEFIPENNPERIIYTSILSKVD